MTTPDYLRQVRDLRTAIAAGDLTIDTALQQAAADPGLGEFNQGFIHTLLAYSDAEFEAFAAPASGGFGKSTVGVRYMRAAMAASVEHVYHYTDGRGSPTSDVDTARGAQA